MKLDLYNKIRNNCFILQVIIGIAATIIIYFLTTSIATTIVTLVAVSLLIGISFYLYKLDDMFISEIVNDLSKLVDSLTKLEDCNVFPENEDTLVSKLQNKIVKLVRILKNTNIKSSKDQESIKSLVSDISHQLKTPIANLKMYSEFLADDSITDVQRKEYVDVIRICVGRLNFLSESMIKISRLESGLINLNLKKQLINETALKAIKDVFSKAKAKNIEIQFYEESSIALSHDRNWTSEAIFNLLDNAVKYSKTSSVVKLNIKLLGMFIAIEVADENEIIAESEQAKIFQRFYRGKGSNNTEGIGVGLYLSREIIVKQGGYVSLKSSPQGNVFYILLPVDT